MARLSRVSPPGIPQHVVQRGNNRQVCFASEQDMAFYAALLQEYSTQFLVSIHAWVFMTNHVHLLATPQQSNGISQMMQAVGRRYVRYFNREYRRSGTLWEGRFKSSSGYDGAGSWGLCLVQLSVSRTRKGGGAACASR